MDFLGEEILYETRPGESSEQISETIDARILHC